ncbi:MAG: glycerol-3-phosphate 1-O-acyltransferase PlsY [Oscillospiraceae bacterium]|nr:glycerol-3-phosphate 1-O-acyltransferase PlsY [Oscillospiraceae bacterium]
MNLLVFAALAYLIGSVPFALVVGKGVYDTDVREYGSKNLGASNTGRVLGPAAGATVMILDAVKAFLVVFLAVHTCNNPLAIPIGGLAAAIGHCYPLFAKFKGGKAVAALYGFLFGLFVFAGMTPLIFFLPLLVFLVTLFLTKIISLSSILSAAFAAVCAWSVSASKPIIIVLVLLALLIVYRHRENIKRIHKGKENKITWM